MSTPHATAADYLSYTGVAGPSDIDRLLLRATELVDQAAKTAVYDVDDSGNATDTAIAAALRDATCAQVSYWVLTGDEQGAAYRWGSVSIGSVSLSRGFMSGARLAPHAHTILSLAGLLPGVITSF